MAEHVLVLVPRPPSDGLGSAGGEALGAGRQLASEFGVPLVCAVIGVLRPYRRRYAVFALGVVALSPCFMCGGMVVGLGL